MRVRQAALCATALALAQPVVAQDFGANCAPADLDALTGWHGAWATENGDAVIAGISGRESGATAPLSGNAAPWNDNGRARVAAVRQYMSGRENRSAGWGFPRMMDSFSEFSFFVAPEATIMVNQYSEVRQIYTDGRGHLPDDVRWATNWGDSIGCWEGDTLVVETVSVRYDPTWAASAPPFSDNAHFIERMRLVEPGRMHYSITVTDPDTLTEPWSVELYFIDAGIDRVVLDAFVERHDMEVGTITDGPAGLPEVEVPPTVPLSEAELDRFTGSYQMEDGDGTLQVVRQGGRLLYSTSGRPEDAIAVFPESKTRFTSPIGAAMEFAIDEAGRVTGFTGTSPRGGAAWAATRIGD